MTILLIAIMFKGRNVDLTYFIFSVPFDLICLMVLTAWFKNMASKNLWGNKIVTSPPSYHDQSKQWDINYSKAKKQLQNKLALRKIDKHNKKLWY